MTRFLGIDPGVSGAIAYVQTNGGESYYVQDTPFVSVVTHGKRRQEHDVAEMRRVLDSLTQNVDCFVLLEDAAPRPTDGKVGWRRCGMGVGLWVGLLVGLRIPFWKVHPAVWKRAMSLTGKDKQAVRLLASERFPLASLGRARDHGRAEALFLALYAQQRAHPVLKPVVGNGQHAAPQEV